MATIPHDINSSCTTTLDDRRCFSTSALLQRFSSSQGSQSVAPETQVESPAATLSTVQQQDSTTRSLQSLALSGQHSYSSKASRNCYSFFGAAKKDPNQGDYPTTDSHQTNIVDVLETLLSEDETPSEFSTSSALIEETIAFSKSEGENEDKNSRPSNNVWLVAQLHQRMHSAENETVVAKVLLVTHDVLVHGAAEFARALTPVAESFFNYDQVLLSAAAAAAVSTPPTSSSWSFGRLPIAARSPLTFSPSQENVMDVAEYERGLRFFASYVHALLQFQLRHRTAQGNVLDKNAVDLLLGVRDDEKWSSHLWDMLLSCVALTKFLVTSTTALPRRCRVFAEIIQRYVADSARLYHTVGRVLHLTIITGKEASTMPMPEIRRVMSFQDHYLRVTDQLNDFYDTLRRLPDNVDAYGRIVVPILKHTIPSRLQQLPQHIQEMIATEMHRLEEIEAMQVETLEFVLSDHQEQHDLMAPADKGNDPSTMTSSTSHSCSAPSPGCCPEPVPPRAPLHKSTLSVDSAPSFALEQQQLPQPQPCAPQQPCVRTVHHVHKHVITPNTRFHLLDQVLGKGGFGIVYKAWDEEQGRHVACKEVKLVASTTTTTTTTTWWWLGRVLPIDELYTEYRVLVQLDHPNIVKVLDFMVHQGHGRIFMEWVPSGSVQSVLQETKRGLREQIVRRYIREALQGLAYLHSRGILHRDVKPGNMLLASDGSVKLTDFGTSRAMATSAEAFQTGTVVGTVPYLAPECIRGTYSAASDIWAIGCTALHMITGRAPWADEAQTHIALIFMLGNMAEETVRSPQKLPIALERGVHEISSSMHDFVAQTMRFDRHRRPSAAELLLHPFVGEGIS
ncbi:protein kinase, putative [Bodo saltans]|uniref:non-specific serine/threonine protein kinase n=1 Tax=Bodo saltans TaxID=75058 RepID=A0A0S4JPE7_BODSA|nr:protein kinase, putative [Bodo saltans]|eukprot:CUG92020.1 protein kinase, putative [Bodo saltans]